MSRESGAQGKHAGEPGGDHFGEESKELADNGKGSSVQGGEAQGKRHLVGVELAASVDINHKGFD